MKIHLVYAFSPDNVEVCAPHSITRNLCNYLKKQADVQYYDWGWAGVADVKPDDIFIGHPHYNENTVTQRTIREKKCKVMCTIHPLHTATPHHNMPFDDLTKKADAVFSICGPYWMDTIDQTCFAHWKPKITQLDMAIDCNVWPHLKQKFNNPGERQIVYVGSDAPMKNIGYLAQIASKMKNTKFHWYGGHSEHTFSKLPNTTVIGHQRMIPQIVEGICKNDLFLNVSDSDANPTTLLEFGLASGLIPICTETSGYWKDECFINIPHNLDNAIKIINDWLYKPTKELEDRSKKNRLICENKYTWDKFCSTVWLKLQSLYINS